MLGKQEISQLCHVSFATHLNAKKGLQIGEHFHTLFRGRVALVTLINAFLYLQLVLENPTAWERRISKATGEGTVCCAVEVPASLLINQASTQFSSLW